MQRGISPKFICDAVAWIQLSVVDIHGGTEIRTELFKYQIANDVRYIKKIDDTCNYGK